MSDGWRDSGRVADYLSRSIPHRDIAEALLLQAMPAGLERFVDLGTGDGQFEGPMGLTVDASGDVWVAGQGIDQTAARVFNI